MKEFDKLKLAIEGVEKDVQKAESGNKAATTRVRKAMQEVKKAAQAVRVKSLEFKEKD